MSKQTRRTGRTAVCSRCGRAYTPRGLRIHEGRCMEALNELTRRQNRLDERKKQKDENR